MITSPAFAGRTYHVLGLARTGMSVVAALIEGGASVDAWDDRAEARDLLPERVGRVDPMEVDLAGYDALVVSPGVPLNTHPLAARAASAGVPVIGDIELFALARPSLPAHSVVGITGTNGKSTTTALIHHTLIEAGVPATLGGNIGEPILSQRPAPAGGVYVLELSSYQIDLTHSLACDVAVLLNITPDHLDRYDDSVDAYAASKARLFQMQAAGGVAVITGTDDYSRAVQANRAPLFEGVADDQPNWPALAGPHNRQNAIAAATVLRALGLSEEELRAGFRSFGGLAHRMERVADRGGVLWVNDSKATNADSAAPALGAYDRIHWILGGVPKGPDLTPCEPYYPHVAAAYLIGEAAPVFETALTGKVARVKNSGTLAQAVADAAAAARPGETVLLSPACASFDQFRDYEDRGRQFRALVEALPLSGGNG
ncbi:UDP-N-acetylmuramoyl-L-alanine--D-glutamate ligase [Pacificimonas flava]|uniref:UDP-N-acetylmuramoylalanine--D-glutamate ligase n=1 Tax=Pacificimonas flava TaxID=1234595 RepID=M2TKC8_9SPHN|nr:UDP-N-acetylmuramoyl-L-alanine--D-glutamate ligase [Pacificimonas flava]EMD82136.1 UDP-N-acetylmuramoylalanine--D-glutamate ligase [Pacificimonas flava]MBB5280384.1 UDP-N-acetylmuramoylalanine--D-glutamate ligase [Pacificimonas flava]